MKKIIHVSISPVSIPIPMVNTEIKVEHYIPVLLSIQFDFCKICLLVH